jgi:hypothetical protein
VAPSRDPLASSVTGWLTIGRDGVAVTTATGRSGVVNGPLVPSGTVAVPPSLEVTVIMCGGASTCSKVPTPSVRAPYRATVSVAPGSLDRASTVRAVPS